MLRFANKTPLLGLFLTVAFGILSIEAAMKTVLGNRASVSGKINTGDGKVYTNFAGREIGYKVPAGTYYTTGSGNAIQDGTPLHIAEAAEALFEVVQQKDQKARN